MLVKPENIQSPIGEVCPYCGTLGRTEWELVAAVLVSTAQETGSWKAIDISGWHRSLKDEIPGMVKAGWMRGANDCYQLTQKAKFLLCAHYPDNLPKAEKQGT